jgi:hypothetical protein
MENLLQAGYGDIVVVHRKTRSRFKGEIALPGDTEYLVLSAWVNTYGTVKMSLLSEENEERFTSRSCTEVVSRQAELDEKWDKVHRRWMEETYVPILVTTVRSAYARPPSQIARSKNGLSILVRPLASFHRGGRPYEFWVNKRFCHPDDWWALDKLGPSMAVGIRIPVWLAKQNGVLGEVVGHD